MDCTMQLWGKHFSENIYQLSIAGHFDICIIFFFNWATEVKKHLPSQNFFKWTLALKIKIYN